MVLVTLANFSYRIDVNGGFNEAAIGEWQSYIFNKKMEEEEREREDDEKDHDLEDFLWVGGSAFFESAITGYLLLAFQRIWYC